MSIFLAFWSHVRQGEELDFRLEISLNLFQIFQDCPGLKIGTHSYKIDKPFAGKKGSKHRGKYPLWAFFFLLKALAASCHYYVSTYLYCRTLWVWHQLFLCIPFLYKKRNQHFLFQYNPCFIWTNCQNNGFLNLCKSQKCYKFQYVCFKTDRKNYIFVKFLTISEPKNWFLD